MTKQFAIQNAWQLWPLFNEIEKIYVEVTKKTIQMGQKKRKSVR